MMGKATEKTGLTIVGATEEGVGLRVNGTSIVDPFLTEDACFETDPESYGFKVHRLVGREARGEDGLFVTLTDLSGLNDGDPDDFLMIARSQEEDDGEHYVWSVAYDGSSYMVTRWHRPETYRVAVPMVLVFDVDGSDEDEARVEAQRFAEQLNRWPEGVKWIDKLPEEFRDARLYPMHGPVRGDTIEIFK